MILLFLFLQLYVFTVLCTSFLSSPFCYFKCFVLISAIIRLSLTSVSFLLYLFFSYLWETVYSGCFIFPHSVFFGFIRTVLFSTAGMLISRLADAVNHGDTCILVPKQAHTAPSRQRRNCSVPGIKLYIPYYRPFYLWRSKPILYLQAMVFCPAKFILSSWLGGLWNEKHVISWEPSTMGGRCLEQQREKPSKEDLVKGKVRSEKGMFKWKECSTWGWAILFNFYSEYLSYSPEVFS